MSPAPVLAIAPVVKFATALSLGSALDVLAAAGVVAPTLARRLERATDCRRALREVK